MIDLEQIKELKLHEKFMLWNDRDDYGVRVPGGIVYVLYEDSEKNGITSVFVPISCFDNCKTGHMDNPEFKTNLEE
jgi:hypothetical protein